MADLLHHERVTAPEASADRWLLVLHGLLGSGRNWAGVARRLVQSKPGWGAVLVDLREHGQSVGHPGPHTLEAAARDVRELVASLDISAPAILGHSFGGKVAMLYASSEPAVERAFIIDSTPDRVESGGQAGPMLQLLRQLPSRYASREEAIGALESRGVSRTAAQWIAMNLISDQDAFRWRMDLSLIEGLYEDFRRQDLWHALEGQGSAEFHFVRARGSDVITPDARDRLRAAGPHVHLHEVEGGHWLNVDNSAAVIRILAENLPT